MDHHKDRKEIKQLTRLYGDKCSWRDKGILKDLEQHFGITKPTLILLRDLAIGMGKLIGIEPGRQVRRCKNLAIGWMNEHYDLIAPHIVNVLINPGTGLVGLRKEDWESFAERHPDDKGVLVIAGEL
jgi:hypothetical protein